MNNQARKYVKSSKNPMRFDHIYPGSLFRIVAELSRGQKESKDERIYRRARDHEGFWAHLEGNTNHAAILMPYDLVQPLIVDRKHTNNKR